MEKVSIQAGQSIFLLPERGRILSVLSHFGQLISTLTTFFITLKTILQDEQRNAHGLSSTPTRRIFEQLGQPTFSSIQESRVGLCSTRDTAEHTPHSISPNS